MVKLDFRLRSLAPVLQAQVFWEKRTISTEGRRKGRAWGLDTRGCLGRESKMPHCEVRVGFLKVEADTAFACY